MKKLLLILGIVIAVILVVYAVSSSQNKNDLQGSNNLPGQTVKLNWYTDINSALQEAQKTNKQVFIDFYADWCPYCKKLDENTYPDPKVSAKLSQNYVLVKINTDQNPALASQYKVYGLPTMVILNSNGQEIKRISGYLTPEQILNQL
jgi:thioredoxin 1